MIKRVFEKTGEIKDFLSRYAENTVMISALADTYGLESELFSLWTQSENGELTALIGVYGDGMNISASVTADGEELIDFISFCNVSSVIVTDKEEHLFSGLSGFVKKEADLLSMRNVDKLQSEADDGMICLNPSISDVHSLMKEYLSVSDRDTFVCDMQARINHGTGRAVSACSDGNTAAIACVFFESECCGFLGGVATDERYRGRGLASALVSHICNDLLKQNKTPLISCVNPAAKRLYKSLGFEDMGKRITYVKERP